VDIDVHTIFPHAHSLCRELSVTAELPDGSHRPLIAMENFDENWHDLYRYAAPVRLPKGTRLVSTFIYDNTDQNVRNRNHPARRVVYGSSVTDEMADVYLQITTVRPDQRDALMEQYKSYQMRAEAAGHSKTLEMFPDNPWSQEALAACSVGIGDPAKAVKILEKRLQHGPREVFPVTSLGLAYLASGDVAKSESRLQEAVKLDPSYALAWFGLGKALAAQQKSDAAEKALRKAVELTPGMLDASINLADLLIRKGQLQEAMQVCAALPPDSPDMAGVYLKMAEISAKERKYDAALEFCSRARERAPYTHPPKVLVAVMCCANGDMERGEKYLREARSETPDHPMAALILGQLAARQPGRWIEARDHFATARATAIPDNWPESHRRRFLILLHSQRAQIAQQLQDLELARDALTQWIACEPENKQLRTMLDSLPPAGQR
jgi:tetratricopeptide (TPR) repeat protein